MPANTLTVTDGVISAADRPQGDLWRARRRHRSATARRPARSRRSRRRRTRSSASRCRASTFPARSPAASPTCRTCSQAGMVHGRVVRPPRYGSTLESVDEAEVAKAMPGVIAVVRDGSFLGVVAEREEQAIKAREALGQGREMEARAGAAGPGQHLRAPEVAAERRTRRSATSRRRRRPRRRADASRRPTPSPIWRMPRSGRPARWRRSRTASMTVWTHSQGVFPLRNELAKALKMPAKDIRCIHVEGSGCYGQNGADDVALDAALLARAVPGKPVRLQWMRDDEFAWEPYGAAMSMSAKASLDADGQIADWQLRVVEQHPLDAAGKHQGHQRAGGLVPGRAAADTASRRASRSRPAAATATRSRSTTSRARRSCIISSRTCRSGCRRCARSAPTPTCSRSNPSWTRWRALAKADPVAFRLAHLKDPRAKAVIEKAAADGGLEAGRDGRRARAAAASALPNTRTSRLLRRGDRRRRGRPRAAARCACRACGRRPIPG